MIRTINVSDVFNKDEKIFIDVRSPYEFNEGTIPNAINMPLFNDEERIEVGKIYKSQGVNDAIIKGLEFTAIKLPPLYKKVIELCEAKKDIIIFCSRGGLRSSSVTNLLDTLGVTVFQLEGGYRALRKFTLDYFRNIDHYHQFIVLHGYTGVGKTEILKELAARNIPILNFEQMAQNTGSVFGSIGYFERTINQKTFEASIIDALIKASNKTIVVESESRRIGNVVIPKELYRLLNAGKHVYIETSVENRIKRLVNDYVIKLPNGDEYLKECIAHLRKRMGDKNIARYVELIQNKQHEKVIKELILNYYDPLYKSSFKKYNYDLFINYDRIDKAVDKIEDYYGR
ncbi:tRNA 2-selenouridine synthase [Natronincola peptidivorans]|uniref:tRNA 2-selenouridine synthase n=1 Tax=Natronincola peptidivorans TaxID=426128 RepID=A0A1H9YIG5_9FIRM|nr:tRNA 2-selenouridine(34) synthase MnmH [Natronincola peptidivorans]SES68846.1 tRNA 2-selenouridine synthase [Natronincola peptidivorans]